MPHSDIRIETDRLILRPPQAADFERYAELLASEAACRFTGGHMPRAAAWRKFLQMPGAWAVQGFSNPIPCWPAEGAGFLTPRRRP